ncbi:DUF5682 family protein [Nocardioides zeae]
MAEVPEVDAHGTCWVPVRHHSPAATRAVRDLVARLRPAAVLVEGPADYTRIDQLLLAHEPPVSLMTWFRRETPERTQVAYALYPFAVFSPEWHAVRDGAAVGADVRFVDLPWHLQVVVEQGGYDAGPATTEGAALHRTDEVSPSFFDGLAAYTGRREMSAVWDELAEIDPGLGTATYLRRAALLGAGIRADGDARRDARALADRALDEAREAHMAAEVRRARADHPDGVLLVVTGAAHTAALQERLAAAPGPTSSPVHPRPPTTWRRGTRWCRRRTRPWTSSAATWPVSRARATTTAPTGRPGRTRTR